MTALDGLPPDVLLWWGLRPPPRRGPKATLSVEQITAAAGAVADVEGLSSVSMARVAAELGSGTMSLYRYVASKDELLLMSDAAIDPPPPAPEGADWLGALEFWARNVLAALRRHPWYVQIPITGPPAGPRNLARFDAGLQSLTDTALHEGQQVEAVMTVITYVQGQARMTAEMLAQGPPGPHDVAAQYGAALAAAVDPRVLPALGRVVTAGVFVDDGQSLEADLDDGFEFGLQVILHGIGALVDAAGPSSAAGPASVSRARGVGA